MAELAYVVTCLRFIYGREHRWVALQCSWILDVGYLVVMGWYVI